MFFIKGVLDGLVFTRCNFRKMCVTGRATTSWNDCFGCLINDRSISQFCQGRWYLFKEGPQGEHCLDFPSDIISRGLYAAQISWWFHLFSPEQFLFLSASDLFKVSNSFKQHHAAFVYQAQAVPVHNSCHMEIASSHLQHNHMASFLANLECQKASDFTGYSLNLLC